MGQLRGWPLYFLSIPFNITILSVDLSLLFGIAQGHHSWQFELWSHSRVHILYVFFGKMSIQVLCPFKNWVLICKNSLHILDITPYQIYHFQVSSPSQ